MRRLTRATRHAARTVCALALFAALGCDDTTGPVLEPGDGGTLPPGVDGGVPPGTDGGEPPPPDGELGIEFVEPTGDLSVNNVVRGRFSTTGAPERVEVLVRVVGDPSFELDRHLPAPYGFTQDLSVHDDGTQLTLQGRATRGAEAVTTETITVTVDRSLPEEFYASITRPDSGTVVDERATMHASIRGPSRVGVSPPEIDGVEWLVDGEVEPSLECTNGAWQSTRGCVVEWDTATIAAGRYEVVARFSLTEGGSLTSLPIFVLVVHEGTNPAFERLGSDLAIPSSSGVYDLHMSIDGAGRVVFTYRLDGEVLVRRWSPDAGAFVPLGDPVASGPLSLWPRVALDGMDRPVVTWTQETGGGAVTVRAARFESDRWRVLGRGFNDVFDSVGTQYSMVAIDPTTDRPVVAWLDSRDDGGDRRVRTGVAGWSGSAWEALGIDLGAELSMPEYVAPSSLTVTAEGVPVVAYADAVTDRTTTYVREHRGGRWSTMDTVSLVEPSGNGGLTTDFARAADGTLYLATHHRLSGISVFRADGGSFSRLGGALTAPSIPGATITYREPYLSLDSAGRPVVAFSTSVGGRAFRWSGSAWEAIGTGFLEDTLSTHGVRGLEIDGSDRVYVLVGTEPGPGLHDVVVKTHSL